MPSNFDDEAAFERYGLDLVAAVNAAIRPWLNSVVAARIGPATVPPETTAEIDAAIEKIATQVNRSLTELATADVDEPLSGPLERIRRETTPLVGALDDAGATRPRRDPVDTEMRPDDVYAIGPYTFMDLSTDVHDAGIAWGAAKAFLHRSRRATRDENPFA